MKKFSTTQRLRLHEKGEYILENIKHCENMVQTAKDQLDSPFRGFQGIQEHATHNLEIANKMQIRFQERYNKLMLTIQF